MTHPSPRFRTFAQLTAYASCVCLAFACAGATENHEATSNETTTDSGPTNSGGSGGAATTGVVNDCPSLEPAPGSGCVVDAQVCEYANCTAPDYRDTHTLSCIQGAWQLTAEDACENVFTTCPPSISRGAFCDVPEGSGPCSVIDACGALRNTYCTDSAWEYRSDDSEDAAPIIPPGSGGAGTGPSSATVTTSPRPAPQCPDVKPAWGTACCPADYPAFCDYPESGSDAAVGSPSAATGFGATGAAPSLTCAICSPDMIWTSSIYCP